jgi:hypothetical protein
MMGYMRKKSNDHKNKENLVLTPGGFRPKSSVKHVAQNEAVSRSDDGTYIVIPQEQLPKGESKSECEETLEEA